MTIKKVVRYLHLWIGLLSGICIFIVSITGALLVFQSELEYVFSSTPDYSTIQKENRPFLPPSVLVSKINKVYPAKNVLYMEYYGPEHNAAGVTHTDEGWGQTLINPYSGEITETPPTEGWSFFEFITEGHVNLWIPSHWFNDLNLGTWIVRFTTLFFTIMLISGMVLWWPKNKAGARQRFWFRWKISTRWRRKNYDLHNIVGFYCSWIVIFMCFTGLIWSFEWFSKSVYFAATGIPGLPADEALLSDSTLAYRTASNSPGVDQLFFNFYQAAPLTQQITIGIPQGPGAGIELYQNFEKAYKREGRTYDQYTLQPIKSDNHSELTWEQANAGDKILRVNGDIHFGSVFGIATKVPVFIGCLLAASLPLTGFYIWWGRKRRMRNSQSIFTF